MAISRGVRRVDSWILKGFQNPGSARLGSRLIGFSWDFKK